MTYYLSTYLSPPGLSTMLGISPRHDNNLSLWRLEGATLELVRHWELERLSGEKQHGRAFGSPTAAWAFIDRLLADEGVAREDLAACWGTPGLDIGGPYASPVVELPLHAVAHAYSALYLDSDVFHGGRILCFAPDGGPDHVLGRTLRWYAGAYVDQGRLRWLPAESPGRIYDSARKAFGLREGTLMALASACQLETPTDGASLVEDLRFFGAEPDDILGGAVAAGDAVLARAVERIDRCLGPRPPEVQGFSPDEVRIAAVMRLLQSACEAVMIRNVDTFLATAGVDPSTVHLGLAGGYALNCPTNSMLMRRYGFAGLLAPPCANDSGQALGVGLALLHQRVPRLEFCLGSAYCGPPVAHPGSGVGDPAATFVEDVTRGPVAWIAGNSEIGPRALGHRSLLADPRQPETKALLNRLKGRQWWRPVAPIVLESEVSEWFDLDRRSPYMLETAAVRPDRTALVPAIVHIDGTARIQTLSSADDPLLHRVLESFRAHTGVPLLANTSLNGPGQPIVQTTQQALAFCAERGIQVCYVDGHRVVVHHSTDTVAAYDFPPPQPPDAAANPHGLTGPEIYHALTTPALHGLDLPQAQACAEVRGAAGEYYRQHPGELAWVTSYLARH